MQSPPKFEAGPSLASPKGGVPCLHIGNVGELDALPNNLAAIPAMGVGEWSPADRAGARAPFLPQLAPQESAPADTYRTLELFKQLCSQQDWSAVLDMKNEVKALAMQHH